MDTESMLHPRLRRHAVNGVVVGALAVLVTATAWVVPARAVVIAGDSAPDTPGASQAAPETTKPTPRAPGDDVAAWTVPECTGPEQVTSLDPATALDRIVLDPVRRLPAGWAPDDLVDVPALGRSTDGQVREIIVDDLVAMHAAAAADGVAFDVVSGFRSDAYQHHIHTSHLSTLPPEDVDGPPTVAPSGHSEHQLGTTIDVIHPGEATLSTAFGDKPAAQWLATNAADHGFVVSYPRGEQATTCYGWEPWHLRWVGIERAREMTASGMSPREFLLREEATRGS